jgi:hypothetical protein
MMYFLKRFLLGSLFFILYALPSEARPAQYAFATHWEIRAPLNEVWNAIYQTENWPQWWKGVKAAEVCQFNPSGVGSVIRFAWRSWAPYTLHFTMELTEQRNQQLLRGIASGDLEGTGTWLFSEHNGITCIDYYWRVKTTKDWMNLLSPILAPVFRSNHDALMKQGARGLARKLNAELLVY